MRAIESYKPWPELKNMLDPLLDALNAREPEEARKRLEELVDEYVPNSPIADLQETSFRAREAQAAE